MLKAENISYQIDNKTLLNNISIEFNTGETTLIVGANGAGKSTLIKVLSKELNPTAGTITFNKQPIQSFKTSELAKVRAVLSQSNELAFPLLVEEVIMMGRYPHFDNKPAATDIAICKQAMELFDITKFKDRNFLTLSGGEKQRVHFARIVAQIWNNNTTETKLLFLDEPLTFLDIRFQLDFMNIVKEFIKQQNLIIIGVLHDLNLAIKYADKILLLDNGNLLKYGTPKEVLTSENIEKTFKITPHLYQKNKEETYLIF
ncbi:MAG: heme ABC transporter ATP-binding protein [Vicingus serpentipes]|nr:heme ABC transporter ATP-binding protein [Vicingus serpentipes]